MTKRRPAQPIKRERSRRFVAVTCSHGRHLSPAVASELAAFLADYRPEVRIHLGDVWDTTAWRAGADGTADETSDIDADFSAGADFLRQYEPHLVFLGNHDVRPYRQLQHPKAIIRKAARDCVDEMEKIIRDELKAELVPYHIQHGWRLIGGTAFGHGYMYSENAVRDSVEMLSRPVIMGHVHTLQSQPGRIMGAPMGHSAGLLADISSMDYASTRRATLRWLNGWIYGEFTPTKTRVFSYTAAAQTVGDHPKEAFASADSGRPAGWRDDR